MRDFPANAGKNFGELVDIFRNMKEKGCKIVFVVIPKKNSPLYSSVKQAAELEVGMLTQCVVASNVAKGQQATIQNILLKVNSKLGGVNQVIVHPPTKEQLNKIDILKCPMLIIGAGKMK